MGFEGAFGMTHLQRLLNRTHTHNPLFLCQGDSIGCTMEDGGDEVVGDLPLQGGATIGQA